MYYTVYLNSLLLLLVNHVPHLKQCLKRIPIMGVQRPRRLCIHNAPEMCHIDLEVTFTRSARDKVTCRDARPRIRVMQQQVPALHTSAPQQAVQEKE